MSSTYIGTKEIKEFSRTVNKLRDFFLEKGFIECHTQDRLSILAACEDPTTVATYEYAGEKWPLPQTGQMWLEHELLNDPALPGVFCVSTSYRNEKNPIPGRHKIIFPMFEFESRGDMDDLRALEEELCEYLGFGPRESFAHVAYDDAAERLGVSEIGSAEERKLCDDCGSAVFLERFPHRTSPFWNMRKNGEHAHKIDVLLGGMETIGSAERSSDPDEMREQFHTISEGEYAKLLFDLFGRERVEAELESFLSLPFFPRFGGGIGMTRLMSALQGLGIA
jgi:aspartyl/asparaginyl-tRNA synthetase